MPSIEFSNNSPRTKIPIERLDALTSLRFFAASLIVLKHLADCFPNHNTAWIERLALHQGVAFFFVLSGFILTYVHPELASRTSKIEFLWARFGRIYPTHLIGLIATCWVTQAFSYQKHFLEILCANLLLVQDWIPKREFFFSLNAPAWSISCEFFFYLSFLFIVQKVERWWLLILIGSLLLAFSCLAIDANVLMTPSLGVSEDVHRWLTMPSPLLRLFEFCLGVCAADYFRKLKQSNSKLAFVNSWSEFSLAILSLALIFLPKFFSALPPDILDWRIVEYICSSGGAPFYAALILVFAFQVGKLSRFVAHPVFVLLGEISFALYILHYPLILFLMQHKDFLAQFNQDLLLLLIWLFLLIVSYFNFRFIERPLRKLLVPTSTQSARGY